MKKSVIKKSLFALFALLTFSFTFHSCDSWMSDDDNFYEEIENEVKKANAPQISVFVRYAATKMGKTDPDGYSTFKVEIPSTITATTEIDYGFKRWAAFSTSFLTPGDTQYTNFVYEDDESYAANYGQYELSSDIVRFENPTSTTTSVTIYEERNDIYIVPVVAKRPTIALTMPASGSSGIVRNMTVRINFTKQMNPASFKDANGAVDKITITQGTQSITSDGDIEISSTEITNRFAEPAFSTNGKMITLKFTPEAISEGFTAQSYVTINISKDVTDIYGYSMAEDYKLQFQVGSSFDTLAPRISELTAGVGQNYNTFGGVYKDADTVSALGSLTQIKLDGAAGANADIDNNPLYTDSLLAQRIKDKVNIRVVAEDLAGSGSGQDTTGAESEVSMIGVRATSIALMSGAAAAESNAIPLKSLAYVGQTNTSEIQGSYRDITGANKGFLFTYDVSSLPDGLIKIDVWAYDSIGNSGLLDGGAYSSEYGNGYASIFVVKDTTPPDAAANTPLIGTSSTAAPYGWYNATTLGSMKLYEVSPGSIFDNGHPRLRSKADKLQWFFNVTSDTSWAQGVTKDDARWVNVSDGYSIANAAVPASDGPVALSLILKDDLGNISTAAPLSSIMYDNTVASLAAPEWVNADGSPAANNVTNSSRPAQILKVPFDGNISGIRRLYVTTDYANPLENAVIKYAGNGEAPNALAAITAPVAGNLVELPASYTSGVFYIEGITITDTEGLHTVSVTAYDSSLNVSGTVSRSISVDKTAPVITTALIEVVGESSALGNHYIPSSAFVSSQPSNVSLRFNITETGSGIHAIKITNGEFDFVPGATSIAGLSPSDYSVTDAKTIILPDSYSPKIFGANVTVTINGVKLNEKAEDAAYGSYFTELKVEDFLDNPSALKRSYEDFYVDKTPPAISSVEVTDLTAKSVNYFTNPAGKDKNYTDSTTVELAVKLSAEAESGVHHFVLGGATVSGSNIYTLPASQRYANVAADTIVISNVVLSGGEGSNVVTVTPVDTAGWAGLAVNSNSIIYDATVPVFSADPTWTATPGSAVGVASGDYLDTQILNIPFTDAHAGVKKFRISLGSAITDPIVNNSHLKVGYNGTEITGITVTTYDVGSNHYGEITLPTPVTSGTLTVQGIHANISTDATYTVTVALMDAAYNSSESASVNSTLELTHDQTAPVINKIEIPGLKLAKDIFSKESKGWWLDHEYIGGPHNNNYAATQVPLYITINEKTSGVNLITLDGGTLEFQSNSTLWTVASDGKETPFDPAKYTVDTTAKTITINNASDSLKNPDGKDEFVILIKDLKATKTGNTDYNTISVRVDDVALNKSASKTEITVKDKTQTLSEFYTDSWNCGIASVEIEDGDASPVPATSGYTNNKIVTVNTTYGGEGSGASGHNKFTFTGAKFTDASKVYIATSISDTNSALENVKNPAYTNRKEVLPSEYVISQDQDKTTLEFRNADATEYYVVINIFALQITNMELDNATTDGTKTVVSYASDLSGWNSGEESGSIILDTTPPEWRFEAGTFAANKSETINGEFIYPHPNATDTAYGIKSPTAEKNKDGEIVLYYYTASKISGLANYGVVIGIGGKDANLRGYDYKNGVPYYICDTTRVSPDEVDANYVAKNGSMPSKDCNNNTTGSNSGWKTGFNGWEIMFAGHTYSIVIVDEAGNYSTAKTIKIVQDTTKPAVTYDGSDYSTNKTKSLTNVMTLQIPNEANIFRNATVAANGNPNAKLDLWESINVDFKAEANYTYNYVIKKTDENYKIIVKLAGTNAGETLISGKTTASHSAYPQMIASTTDSGLAAYSISHWYGDWVSDDQDTASWEPAFPSVDTPFDPKSYFGFGRSKSTYKVTNCNWHDYQIRGTLNTDTDITSYIDTDGNIVINIPNNKTTAPLSLLLKDNCGNLNYVLIRTVEQETAAGKQSSVSWVVDDMISTDTTYSSSIRHIGMNPYMKAGGTQIEAYNLDGTSAGKFNWGNRTSPYQFDSSDKTDGQTGIGVQARDLKGRVTYYNNKAYISLFNKAETCTYGTRSIKNGDDGNGYTLRAVIRAWNSDGAAPTKNDFINSDGTSKTGEDFSNWIYLRDVASNSNNDYVLQYPHPTREEKFRLYYYVEDAVGNYEINTIVNDNKADGSSDQMLYWMYDNVGPKVLTRSGDDPATITGANINKLVATNNGFRPYYNAGTGYIVETKNKIVGTGLPDETLLGNGILLGCIRGENTKYGSYFDLDITETSGIRAFAYTSTSTAPAIPTSGNYGTASMGDDGTWYAGKTTSNGGTGMLATREIGSTLTYPYYSATSGTSLYSNAGDVSYDYYDASYGNYVYSGVKVVATIPYGVIKEDSTTPKDVYLHVMDWVGNITTVKLGNGIKWVNDALNPDNDKKTDTNIYKDNCNITTYGDTSYNLQYTFAATKIPSDATSLKVYIPDSKYSDSGSGLLGWSLTQYDLNTVQKDEIGSYIEITGDKLTKIKAGQDAGTVTVYVYDNVGNCPPVTLKLVGDKTPVPFTLYVRGTNSSADAKDSFVVDTLKYMDGTSANGNNELGATATQTQIKTAAEVQNISSTAYVKDKYVTFLPCFGAYNATSHADYYRTEISYWDSAANKWKALDSSSTTALNGWLHTAKHTDDKRYYTTNNYTLDPAKIYYQFAVYDKVGNVNYLYAKIMQDNTPPTATVVPGSIEKVNQIGGKNYYSTNSTAKMRYSDAGSGLKSYTGVSSVTGYVTESPEIEENLGTRNAVSGKLQFTAKDNLGNGGSIDLSYDGITEWVKDTTAPVATALSAQSAHKYTHNWSTSDSNSTNFEITSLAAAAGDFDNVHGSIQVVPGSGNAAVVSVKNVTGFKFKPAATDTNLYGWYVNNEQKTGAELGFISVSDVTFTSEYTFNSVPSSAVKYYFYPVDKAGNAGDPIILTFVEAAVPVINSVTPDSTTIVEKDGKYYFNSSSKITVEVHNPTESAVNISSVRLAYSKNGSFTGSYTPGKNIAAGGTESITVVLSDNELKNISDSPLYVWADTGTVSSAYKQLAYTLTYDGAGPANISISSVTGKNGSGAEGFAAASSITAVTYGKNAASIEITPVSTDLLDVKYSTSSSGPWGDKVTFTTFGSGTKIYAKDSLGNVSNQPITFTLDDTVSAVSLTFNNSTGIFNDSANNILYYKADASPISITAKAGTDTDIAYYYYNASTNKSLDGNFTIENPDGLYNFYAVDNLGNETEVPAGITITKDDSIEIPTATFKWYKGETEVTEASYVSASGNAYTYNSNQINKIEFTPSVTSDVSGIKGYATSATAADADWKSTVTISNPTGSRSIYAKDNVGNISEPLTYSFTPDGTGVKLSTTGATISGSFGAMDSTPPANVTANGVSGTVSSTIQGKDDIVGNGYTTQFIPSGSTFTVRFDGVHADLAGYGFTIGNTAAAYTDAPASFTPVADPSGATLTVTLPDITEAHAYLFLWLKDKVGNLSCYNVCNGNMNWWLTQNNPAGFTWKVENETIVLTGLKNVPINSISINGANISKITFGFDIDTNHKASKSYTNNNASSLGGYFAGEDKITLTVSNASNVTGVSVTTIYGDTPITGTKDGLYASAARFVASAASSVKSLFTPKSKKVDLTAQSRIADKSESTTVNSVSLEPVERFEPVKESELQSSKAKPVKNQPARTKKIASRSADSTKVSSVSAVSPVLPENAKVLEAKPIQLTVENEEHIINVVENNPSPQQRVPASLVIFTMVTVIAVAGIFITSKKIVDKYN